MAEFQHISVVPADEEELVIRAGARAVTPASAPEGPATEAAPVAPVAPVAAAAAAPGAPAAPMTVAQAQDALAEAQYQAASDGVHNFTWALQSAIAEEKVGKPAKEGYRETTLEDLESTPMPPLQKAVFGVVVAVLVAFIIYCVLHFSMGLI